MSTATAVAQDQFQWLEQPDAPTGLEWARAHSGRAHAEIAQMPGRDAVEQRLRLLLAAGDPPPQFTLGNTTLIRYQRSSAHPHGVLSIAPRQRNGTIGPWRDVLDVDALREREGAPYELRWYGVEQSCLPPAYTRCILSLSPAGADDVELREFDLETGQFVDDGFRVPASRAFVVWLDRDRLLIEHTVADARRTATGWPARVSIWRRGTPLSSATPVYDALPTDALLILSAVGVGDERVGVITRAIDYSTLETMLVRADGAIEPTSLPTQTKMTFPQPSTERHLIAQLSQDVVVAGRRIPAETIVAYDTASSTPADRRLSVVYTPGEDEFLDAGLGGGVAASANSVWMAVDRRGAEQIVEARFQNNRWRVNRQQAEAPGVSVTFASANASSEDLVVQRTGFLHPTRLDLVRRNASRAPLFAEAPVFDANAFTVELRTATSADGTQIDYYLLRPKAPAALGATPTLMTGYGAFGISFSPGYLDAWVGGRSLALWLEHGGALAVPLIRGGGERGSAWHNAAMRERRQVSYDDFAAVAQALITEGFTTREHLGVFGTSNGGLLAGVMGTQRPDLFGAVVSDVPLSDMLRFPSMGMGSAWINEYGDPSDPAMAEVLRRYSPYHNITAGRTYPAFLITVSTTDNRVGPGHARKLAARLIEAGARVYYLEDQEGGHGVSDPLSRPELMADRMTFLINALIAPSEH